MHGMFMPWDYILNEEFLEGSVAQLSTVIKEYRNDDTLLIDAGDIIQGNLADLFVADQTHPMIVCMNQIGYDAGVLGNHEFDYSMDVTRKTAETFAGKMITGNVVDENRNAIADGYTIIDKGGVRVGLIGMVTPNVMRWDADNLAGCKCERSRCGVTQDR